MIKRKHMKETNIYINTKEFSCNADTRDSLVKDIKGWELSDESNKVVTKNFSGAITTDMKSYLLPTKSRNPENIFLQCSTNDLKKENCAIEISNDITKVVLLCKLITLMY